MAVGGMDNKRAPPSFSAARKKQAIFAGEGTAGRPLAGAAPNFAATSMHVKEDEDLDSDRRSHGAMLNSFGTAGLRSGLPSLFLSEAKVWNGGVLFFCDPVDMVRLSHVSKQYRMVHVSDPLWERWVAPIQEGTYLTRLAETNVLTATRKTLMHAYMMATTGKCFHCGAWTAEVNVLVLLPQCYHCFSCWAQTGLLTKSKAKAQYLLTEKEAVSLARVATPENDVIILARHQVQNLKCSQFGGSLDGLLAEKERRKTQAMERRVKAMNDYEAKKAEALMLGQPVPKQPSSTVSLHLQPGSDICLTDGGARANDAATQQWCLSSVGFRSKHNPIVPRCPSDVEFAYQYILCNYCIEHEGTAGVRGGRRGQVKGDWKRPKFPSFEELYLNHHFRLCPYFSPKDQGEGPPSLLA